MLSDSRTARKIFKKFNPARYAKSMFSMFGGEECDVKLSVSNELIGVMVDRFGSDLYIIKETDHSFILNVKVVLSPQFYAWLFGMGTGVKLLTPQRAVREYRDQIRRLPLIMT